RYEYEYFYLCTCRYRVPIPILLRFGLHESAINLEADFILSSADYVKPIVQNNRRLSQAKNKQSFLVLTHKKAFKQTISSHETKCKYNQIKAIQFAAELTTQSA